jgi:lipid II isoglutaminyl synthase (glutamine-hydrolysing)
MNRGTGGYTIVEVAVVIVVVAILASIAFVGGGGQDSGQTIIQNDLLARADELRQLAKDGVPMLMICGMYQLFGRFFRTLKGEEIVGANILPIETIAGDERMIGNIVIKSQEFGDIVGYENHSGQTFLDKTAKPLGQVIKGAGNNMTDANEGVRYNNIIATYLHGPILPKNPQIADFLISEALERRGVSADSGLEKIDDTLANKAREIALKLSR